MSSSSSSYTGSSEGEAAETPAAEEVPVAEKPQEEAAATSEPVNEPVKEPETVVGDLTPPLVSDLTQWGIEKEFLVKTLAKAHNFEEIVCNMPMRINLTVEFGKKEELMGVLCGLIINHGQFSNVDDAKILKLIQFITGYGIVIDSEAIVAQMFDALVILFDGLNDTTVIEENGFKGRYAPMGYAAYGVRHHLVIEKLTTVLRDASYPLLQALVMLFRNKKYEELPPESQQLLSEAFEGFIDYLLKGNRQSKLFAVRLLDANFNFKMGNDEPSTKIPFDTIVNLLGGDYEEVRLAVVELLTKLPPEHPEVGYDSRLPTVLTHICRQLTSPSGAFAEAVYKFVAPRDQLTGFYDLIATQFLDDVTTVGALILCVELDFFNKRPELTTSAYPTTVSQPRLLRVLDNVKYIVNKFPFSEALAESVMTHLVKIYSSEDLLKKPEIKAAAIESIELFLKGCSNSLRVVNRIFVGAVLTITDVDILLAFASALGKLEIKSPERPLDEAFCKMFCYIYHKLRSYTDMLNIISLFKEIPDRSEPANVVELVEKAVPEECRMRLLRTAETWLKDRPRLLVVSVALPELTNKKLWELTKTLLSPEVLTYELAREFFITLSIRYFSFFLTVLEEEKLGEQVTNNILVAKRKRVAATEAVKAVMAALPVIVKDKELSTEEQERLWKGLCRLMPPINYNDFKDHVVNLHDVFPYIKDVTPTEDQYRKFLYPELARDFPVFLANVPPSDDLAKECIKLWFKLTNAEHHYARETKPIAELAFRLSQAPEVLFAAIFYLKKERSLPVTDEAIPFAYYVWAMTDAARARGIEIDEVMYTDFFLHFSRFNICQNPELRTASVAGIASLFGLDDAPKESGPELSPTEIVEVAMRLYTEVAKHACDRFITVLVQRIINKGKFYVHHGYLLRAIFESRQNFVNDDNIPYIVDLFSKYTRFSPSVKHHFEKGAVALCERCMKEMVPVLMMSDSAFKRLLLERILRSRTLRPLFITEYQLYLNTISETTKSLSSFLCISKIIFYEESNELDDVSYGRVLSELFMWLGLCYDLEPNLNLIEFDIQTDNVSETFDAIMTKTSLARRLEIKVKAGTVKRVSATARRICEIVSNFSISKTNAAYENCMMMLESPNSGYVMAAAIFFLRMLQAFAVYESDEAKDLKKKLKDGVFKALEVGSPQNKLQITGSAYGVIPQTILDELTPEEFTALYKALVIGIKEGREKWCKQNAMLLFAQIIDKVPRESIVIEDFYAAIKAGFDECIFNPSFLKLLDVYLDFDHEISKFAVCDTRLSINGLAMVLSAAEDEILRLLEKIAGSEEIVDAIQAVYSPSQLAAFGTCVVQNASKPYSKKVLTILCKVSHVVKDVDEKPVAMFKKAVVKPLLAVGEDTKHEMRETAVGAVEVIVK